MHTGVCVADVALGCGVEWAVLGAWAPWLWCGVGCGLGCLCGRPLPGPVGPDPAPGRGVGWANQSCWPGSEPLCAPPQAPWLTWLPVFPQPR